MEQVQAAICRAVHSGYGARTATGCFRRGGSEPSLLLNGDALMVWGVKSITGPVAIAVAIALVGCESKVAQCNKLIEVVNQGQTISQNIQGTDAATMEKLSTDLQGLSEQIQAVELEDETLVGFRDRFVKIYQDLGGAAQKVGGALASLNDIKPNEEGVEKAKQLQTDVEEASKVGDQAAKDEDTLVKEVNNYCGGTAPEGG